MATDVNNFSRKRKSTSDLIFEVDEGDCSPTSTPEPEEKNATCSVSGITALSQTSSDVKFAKYKNIDVSIISLPPAEIEVENVETPKLADDLSCVDMEVASPQPSRIDKPFITVILRDKDVASKYKSQIINYIKSVVPFELNEDSNYGLEINLWENHLYDASSTILESVKVDSFSIDKTPAENRDNYRFDTANNLTAHSVDAASMAMNNELININAPLQKIHLKRGNRFAQPNIDANNKDIPSKNSNFQLNRIDTRILDPANRDSKNIDQFVIDTTPSKLTVNRNLKRLDKMSKESKHVDPFVVDTTPSKDREILPRYSPNQCDVIDVLDPNTENESQNKAKQYRSQTVCFNCDGSHAIRDCKEPRDHRRIAIARQKYVATTPKSTRYHLEDAQKYKHIVPGKISAKLRKALSLRSYEIPPYIYRMRKLGYPPGWLHEAVEINTTKLDVFDYDGCAVQNGIDKHPGFIDRSKIINYPGFNVPLEKGITDDYKYFQCPPYSDNHSVTAMVECVEKMLSIPSENAKITTAKTPANVPTKDVLQSAGNSQQSENMENVECRDQSPTLTDLELRKRQLLAELEDGSSSLNSPLPTENSDKTPTVPTTPQAEITESPVIVSSAFGTPIIKSASPFASLPEPDKFSKDISQVINFENLPNTIGKYEQMTKVISKVRGVAKTNIPTDQKQS